MCLMGFAVDLLSNQKNLLFFFDYGSKIPIGEIPETCKTTRR